MSSVIKHSLQAWVLMGVLAVWGTTGSASIPADSGDLKNSLNDVIATTGDEEITFSQLNTMLNSSAIVGLSVPALGTDERNRVRIALLDKVISANLLYLDAIEKGVDQSDEYQSDIQRYADAILASLYRSKFVVGELAISEDEITRFHKESLVPGSKLTAEAHAAIEATLRKEKFKARIAGLRDVIRQGVVIEIQEQNLAPDGDSVRMDADRVVTIGSRVLTWGDVKYALTIPGTAGDLGKRQEMLEKLIDNAILAGKAKEVGLENDPVYQARVNEYRKSRLVTLHRGHLVQGMQPGDSELEIFFKANRERISVPESRKIQMIVVDTKETADSVKARVDAGEMTSYQAALEYSIDPRVKQTLGDFGWVTRGSGFPALDDLTFSLAPDMLGGPVESPAGWHLVKVLDMRDAQYQDLADENTYRFVKRMFIHDQLDRYVVGLRKDAFEVVVFKDRLNDLFEKEAKWIAALTEKAANDPAAIEKRMQMFKDSVKQ